MRTEPYQALLIQPSVGAWTRDHQDIKRNLAHALELIDSYVPQVQHAVGRHGAPLRLIAFAEDPLHDFGPPRTRTQAANLKMAIQIPGPETEAFAAKARQHETYIAASAYEADPRFPGHYFTTGFIINPTGEIILRYRKLYGSEDRQLQTSPYDVLDRYGDDPDLIFPVAETELGNLAIMICSDGVVGPDVARALALQGAEVIIFMMGGSSNSAAYVDTLRLRARYIAMHNAVYLLMPSNAAHPARCYPNTGGHSMLVDFTGNVIAEIDGQAEGFVHALVDVNRLRTSRRTRNPVATMKVELFARLYAKKRGWPPNLWLDRPNRDLDENWDDLDAVISSLRNEDGTFDFNQR